MSATPRPSPTPDSGGQTPSWRQVHEEFFSDMIAPPDCEFPWKFTIQDTGAFIAGPCLSEGAPETGNVTASELSELNAVANRLASRNLETRTCESTGAIVSDFVDLTLPSGMVHRIWERDVETQDFCYRDGRADANALHDLVNSLAQKYYPRR